MDEDLGSARELRLEVCMYQAQTDRSAPANGWCRWPLRGSDNYLFVADCDTCTDRQQALSLLFLSHPAAASSSAYVHHYTTPRLCGAAASPHEVIAPNPSQHIHIA
jgi:hypothetical protein